MKYLYFDLIGGISGDMIVASLLDLENNFSYLKNQLKKINIKEYEIKYSRTQAGHINAGRFKVNDLAKNKRIFQFNEIKNKIKKSSLSNKIKNNILDIYESLYLAEKKVHRRNHVHFKQIGEIDSLIDIASSCILIDKLGTERILYSLIPFGEKVAPATCHMLKSKNISLSKHQYENITPTGIAIIITLGEQIQKEPKNNFRLEGIGYGVGSIISKDNLNVLRIILLQKDTAQNESPLKKDEVMVIQCNIDDMNPQILGFLMDKLYEGGALEVFYQNYYTKKSRLGFLISVLSKCETLDTITDILFKETTTLGIRYFKADRIKLNRREYYLNMSLGKVRIKEVLDKRYKKIIPEYDDCLRIAKEKDMSLRNVLEKIK